jgi:hypothetical protein
MSALDTISLNHTMEELFSNADALPEHAPSGSPERGDFTVHLASILTCSYSLQDLLASRGRREDVTNPVETLREVIRSEPRSSRSCA